jgi:hypothetical protein
MRKRKLTWGLFAGLALTHLSLSPLSVLGMGYMPENLLATEQIIHNLGHLIGLSPTFTSITLPHNGMVEVVFELPFVLMGHLFGGPWPDHFLSVEPVVATAGICAVVFLWTRRVTQCERWAYVLALAAGFTTMLWPYAYLGMETTQSFFLILTGYLALVDAPKSRGRTLAVALCAAASVSVKASGLFLCPAVLFLVLDYCRVGRDDGDPSWLRFRWARLAAIASPVTIVFLGNHYLQMRSTPFVLVAGLGGLLKMSTTTPIAAAMNAVSIFGSPNKGLLVYSPVLVLALAAIPLAWKEDVRIVTFALLALCGIVAGFAMTFYWADEIWGPRYLHSAVAPLVMCLGVAKRRIDFKWRRMIPLGVCAALGFGISFLGVFFWCHLLHVVSARSQQITMEQLLHDPEWNPIRFHGQLLQLWFKDHVLGEDADQLWPPRGHPWGGAVNGESPPKCDPVPISLRSYATPQPFLFSSWRRWQTKSDMICWVACCLSLAVGLALLIRTGLRVFSSGKSSGTVVESVGAATP